MRFAGIDIASETHVLAVVDADGAIALKPTPFAEDAAGYQKALGLLGQPRRSPHRHGGNRSLLEEPVRRLGGRRT